MNVFSADDYAKEVSLWHKQEKLIHQEGFGSSTESLTAILESRRDDPVATYAAEMLGLRGDREALPILKQLAVDAETEPGLREASAMALGRLGDATGITILRMALKNSVDLHEQIYTASKIAKLGYPDGYAHLLLALFIGRPSIQAIAFRELVFFIPISDLIKEYRFRPYDFILAGLFDKNERIREVALVYAGMAIDEGVDDGRLRFAICSVSLVDASELLRGVAIGTMLSWGSDAILFCPSIDFRP